MRNILFTFSILYLTFLLSGCWDREEINDVAFVVGSGIDKEEELYRVSVQIPLVGAMGGQSGGGGGTSSDKTWFVDSATGETVLEAHEKKQQTISRTLSYSHRRVVILGEGLAKDGVFPVTDIWARGQENRLTAFLVIAKGLAIDLLNADAPIEQYPSEMLRELTIGATNDPLFLKTFLYHLVEEGVDPYAPVISLSDTQPGEKGEKTTNLGVSGLAVFNKDKMAQILEDSESQSVLIAMNQAVLPDLKVEAPNDSGPIILQIKEYETSLSPEVNGDEITMKITVNGRVVLLENTSSFHIRNVEHKKKLETLLEEKIKTNMENAIQTLMSVRSDPIGFGLTLRRSEKDVWAKHKGNWKEVYPTVKVQIHTKMYLEDEGVLSKTIVQEGDYEE